MTIVRRPFSLNDDLDAVRQFLMDVHRSTGALHYLLPTRIENQKYGPCGPDYSAEDDAVFKIWIPSDGEETEIIALSHRGSAANYHIEIRPDHKTMEQELFREIESLERETIGNGESRMYMYTVGPDTQRASVLDEMGYEDYGLHEYNYMLPLDSAVPDNPAPEGLTIRGLGGEEDYPSFVDVVGSFFDHCGQYMSVERMKHMTKAQFYRDDLHLVAEDGKGRFVAFCFYRFDPLTKIAEVEAVGSLQEVATMGLEKALIAEGARRIREFDPELVCSVEVDLSDNMNDWLKAAGFRKSVTMNMWGKTIN